MAHVRIADTYTPEGEMQYEQEQVFRGPAAIRSHLESFADFKVLDNRLTAG